MRKTAKHEGESQARERATHERGLTISMTERAKHVRERAEHERELSMREG